VKSIILFDLDGTLIDSTEAILESFSTAFKAFNMPQPNLEKVKELGVEYGQGYYFSKPKPIEELMEEKTWNI